MLFKRRDAGFTLLETLAGFTILSIAMSVLLAGMTTAFRREAASQIRQEQLRLARSQLDSAALQSPLTLGVTTGRLPGGYLWTLNATPYLPSFSAPSSDLPQAFWIEVAVSPPGSRAPTVRLRTLRFRTGTGE